MSNHFAVVLAAGQGTRMKSSLYKVLHSVCGKPMVEHVIDALQEVEISKIVTVVGFGAEDVKARLGDKCEYVLQEQQLGTAHAVMQANSILRDKAGVTIVVCGDTPLLTSETLQKLIQHHETTHAKATILTANMDNPTGYGRIIRDEAGLVKKIVEHKDATEEERLVTEINTGTYCFDNELLFSTIEKVSNDNVQGEYYLPDVIEILQKDNHVISAYTVSDFSETIGVNDRYALSQAEEIMQKRINKAHLLQGVTMINPAQTYIEKGVIIGQDTIIYPGTIIKGNTVIEENCYIGPNCEISHSKIGKGTKIIQSVVHQSAIGENASVGPFAHIRPDSEISNNTRIGNFVEIKKSVLGEGSKVSHLSYIGDAEIGSSVNVGCGSITVNYDGKNKYKTIIEDKVFVGCNSNLIAPVTIQEGSFIAAGSTITTDVPKDSLAIARGRQVNKEGYLRNKNTKE